MDKFTVLEDSVLHIYNALSKKMIYEGLSLDDLNTKLNVIINALGLEDSIEDEEETNDIKDKEETDNIKDEEEIDTEDKKEIDTEDKEEIDIDVNNDDVISDEEEKDKKILTSRENKKEERYYKNNNYSLIMNNKDYGVSFGFNKISERLNKMLPYNCRLSYNDFEVIEQNNNSTDSGPIFKNPYFTVYKHIKE